MTAPFFVDRQRARQARLTPRIVDVLVLIAEGLTDGEIGVRLHISENSVKSHIKRGFVRLRVRNRAGAVAQAYELGVFRTREHLALALEVTS